MKLFEHLEYMGEVSDILKCDKAVLGAGSEYPNRQSWNVGEIEVPVSEYILTRELVTPLRSIFYRCQSYSSMILTL